MADITYIVNEDSPENIIGFEQYSQQDRELLNPFTVNSVFSPNKNYIELHILSLSDELLESDSAYSNFSQLGNAQSAGQPGVSVLTVDPIYDSRIYGYDLGGVKLLYHFLNDLYTTDNTTTQFFIESISADRTEVRLLPVSIKDSALVTLTADIKNKLETQSYFDGFRLNFGNNDLFIALNIDTVDIPQGKAVVVKLYEPLPDTYAEKSKLSIVEMVADSVAYEVDSDITLDKVVQPTIRSANFNLEIADESVIPTEYLSYNDLFSYPTNNSNNEIYSLLSEKGIEISVDFTDYSNYVHFSSAEERLNNFKYKVDLINNYSASLAAIQANTPSTTGSRSYYSNLISGIVSNFDQYERFLYYESGSSSWPKSNTTRPYQNIPSINPVNYVPDSRVSTWYSSQLNKAIYYDSTNKNSLINAIPNYLRDDANNENYLTFIYMIGQHFDNLWLYSKAVTDKYDADNRIDHGISKDLVAEALKNFGVKLYTSNKSVEDLFTTFIGQAYQSGSEDINVYVTGSLTGSNTPIQPTSYDNYQKEVQKRIYHNLPLLLKSKGTERGLRALINCLGIPSDILQIKLYGGRNTNERPFYGDYTYYTSSLDKIRLDNTGSIVTGSTLSSYTSIVKRDNKYTDDLHPIEVGFSPTDNIDNVIRSGAPYSRVTIGDQVWTTTNLDVDRYTDGTIIPQVTTNSTWGNLTTGAWCYYSNSTASGSIYGKLYNWYAIAGIHNAASLTDPTLRKQLVPRGWHMPSNTEWGALATALQGASVAGGKLKATGTTYWTSPNTGATNTSGFTALGSGYRNTTGTFTSLKNTFYAWTSDELDSTSAYARSIAYNDIFLNQSTEPKDSGFAVRVIQDTTPPDFNIDDYLGDPRNLTSDRYHTYDSTGVVTSNLVQLTDSILTQSAITGSYNVQDYVRLIKFYDNTIFKMIKDFIPARAVADTGIVIKPHLLSRNKAKSVILSGSRPEYTGSIDTAFISGSDGDIYTQSVGSSTTAYTDIVQTPQGLGEIYSHASEEAKFNGELNRSYIKVSDKDLNRDNLLKESNLIAQNQTVAFYQDVPVFACALSSPSPLPIVVTRDNQTVDIANDLVDQFFTGITYTSPSTPTPIVPNQFGTFTFPDTNYTRYSITASRLDFPNPGDTSCKSSASYLTQYCDLATTDQAPEYVFQSSTAQVDIRPWFSIGSNTAASFTASWNPGTGVQTQNIINPNNVKFEQPVGTIVNIKCRDPRITTYTCEKSVDILVNQAPQQNVVPVVNLTNQQTGYGNYWTTLNPPGYFTSGSNFLEWKLKVTDGQTRWQITACQFELKVNNIPAYITAKYEWTTQGAHQYSQVFRAQKSINASPTDPFILGVGTEPYIRLVIPPGTGPTQVTSAVSNQLLPRATPYKIEFRANDYGDQQTSNYAPGLNGEVKVRFEF